MTHPDKRQPTPAAAQPETNEFDRWKAFFESVTDVQLFGFLNIAATTLFAQGNIPGAVAIKEIEGRFITVSTALLNTETALARADFLAAMEKFALHVERDVVAPAPTRAATVDQK